MSSPHCAGMALALVLAASPALASEATLIAPAGQKVVPVWRSDRDLDEGEALLAAKADTSLIRPLLSCLAPGGSTVVLSAADRGGQRRGVIVTDGTSKGCRGSVAKEHFRWKQ